MIRYDYRSFIQPQLDAAKSFKRVTPKVGLNYTLWPVHSFYANVGGVVNGVPVAFEPGSPRSVVLSVSLGLR